VYSSNIIFFLVPFLQNLLSHTFSSFRRLAGCYPLDEKSIQSPVLGVNSDVLSTILCGRACGYHLCMHGHLLRGSDNGVAEIWPFQIFQLVVDRSPVGRQYSYFLYVKSFFKYSSLLSLGYERSAGGVKNTACTFFKKILSRFLLFVTFKNLAV